MRKALPLLVLLLSLGAFAQTTYTTTADACYGKANQFCSMPVVDQNGTASTVVFDTRSASCCYLYPNGWGANGISGVFAGFVANPDGTRNSFYGQASFEASDGTAYAAFQFFGYFVSTCSGRGCGGTLGWHYKILTGSTVTVQ